MPEIAAAVCEVVYANFCLGWQGIVLRTACRVVVWGALRAENETADQVLSRQGYRNNNFGAEDIAVMVMRRNSLRGSQRMDEIPIQRVATRSSSCPARVNECEPAREKRHERIISMPTEMIGLASYLLHLEHGPDFHCRSSSTSFARKPQQVASVVDLYTCCSSSTLHPVSQPGPIDTLRYSWSSLVTGSVVRCGPIIWYLELK